MPLGPAVRATSRVLLLGPQLRPLSGPGRSAPSEPLASPQGLSRTLWSSGHCCVLEGGRVARSYPLLCGLQGQMARPAAALLGCEDGRGWGAPWAVFLASSPCGEASDTTRLPTCPRGMYLALKGLSGSYRRALFSNKQAEELLFLSIITRFFPAKWLGRRPYTIFTGLKKAHLRLFESP